MMILASTASSITQAAAAAADLADATPHKLGLLSVM
jgi:hypothetical protein